MFTHAEIKAALSYDPETGIMTWRVRSDVPTEWNTRYSGKKVGSFDRKGYFQCSFKGRVLRVHRLIWWLVTGEDPKGKVDHINGVRTDNRWSNLRLADQVQNSENLRKPHRDNKSGYLGVSWSTTMNQFVAQISSKGRRYTLGYFTDPKAAHEVYVNAKRRLHEFGTL